MKGHRHTYVVMSKLGKKSTADIYKKEYEERAKRNDDGTYIVCYDFEGKSVNEAVLP